MARIYESNLTGTATENWDPEQEPEEILDGNNILKGSGKDDYLFGFGGDDLIFGYAGNDKIDGGSGNDTIEGGAGADDMDGGSGIDTLSYRDSYYGVRIDLASGYASGGDATGDTFSGFENIIGSNYGDILYGDGGANRLEGRNGDDSLRGFGGSDIIYGGSGNDTIEGGAGADTMYGGSGINTLSYFDSYNGVIIDLESGYASGGDATGDVFSGFQDVQGSDRSDDALYGDSGANVLYGFGGNDFLYGRGGDDTILGGGGNDTVEGGAGADTMYGVAGTNTLSYSGSLAGVTINLTSGYASGGDATGDVFSTFENIVGSNDQDDLYGDVGKNRLEGRGGNDVINGAGGRDTIVGGAGADELYGGADADTFVFYSNDTGSINTIGNNADTIHDFEAIDTIELNGVTSHSTRPLAKEDTYLVSWSDTDGHHDIIVQGDDPSNNIVIV